MIFLPLPSSGTVPCQPGWWMDHETVTMFHGTGRYYLPAIQTEGIAAPAYASISYQTAKNYADCIYDRQLVDAAVIRIELPREFVQENVSVPAGKLLWNRRLASIESYDLDFWGNDEDFYFETECRFESGIPPEYLTGYYLLDGSGGTEPYSGAPPEFPLTDANMQKAGKFLVSIAQAMKEGRGLRHLW